MCILNRCSINSKSNDNLDSITSMGDLCFSGCSQLKQIEIPSCVTKICANTFNGAGLINATFVDPIGWYVGPYLDASNIAQDGTLAGWGRTQIRNLKTETFTIDRTYSLDHYNITFKNKIDLTNTSWAAQALSKTCSIEYAYGRNALEYYHQNANLKLYSVNWIKG